MSEGVEIIGIKPTTKTVVTGVEMFRKLLDSGEAGDNVGCLLRGVEREGVERGQVLAKPGTCTPHTKFTAEAYILTKEEGGRHTPFFTNTAAVHADNGRDGCVHADARHQDGDAGDNVSMEVHLIVPIAMEESCAGHREGGKTSAPASSLNYRISPRADHPVTGGNKK